MSELLRLATEIAREAGGIARERFHDPRTIRTKTSEIDLVTDVDHALDRLIRERILGARPSDALLTEENAAASGTSGVRWIVDPLDGTTNYAHAFPHFAISIGVEVDGERAVGVVFDPMRDELFSAERGRGAQLNGKAIRVSEISELRRALLATGFSYDVHQKRTPNLVHFERFVGCAQAIRRAGSAALDFSYVACGRFDGYWELHLAPWDVAAGLLLVEEAGGRVTDFDAGPAPGSGERIVASNGRVHAAMLEVLTR
ncbi:MAG TPA: inositol monophosphatase family protein [Myxococcota bacterium]|nr:inositol monophosphatase family protein [Myxococcota bacterium]